MVFIGFSMARVLACALRISWAALPHNVSLVIAAMLMTNLGVFALYIGNILLAKRILRARRPHLGWHRAFDRILLAVWVSIGVVAVLVITFTVLTFYTRDQSLLLAARDIQLASQTWLFCVVLMPFAILAMAYLAPASERPQEIFGTGSLRFKTILVLMLTTLMTLDAGFKLGTAWTMSRDPINNPPWYYSRACFYGFGFVIEVIYLVIVISSRVDRLYHVPDGSGKLRTYNPDSYEIEARKGGELGSETSRDNSLGQHA